MRQPMLFCITQCVIAIFLAMENSKVQGNLLRVVLCTLFLHQLSLSYPTRTLTLSGATMVRVNWTEEGVRSASKPLYVNRQDILKFECGGVDSSRVYLLRVGEYEKVSDACSSSGVVSNFTLASLCRPGPIADCRQRQPERTVDGANETATSCSVSSFIAGMSYYLTNFPSNDPSRCQFALPLRVCAMDDPDCPPSESSPSPSPSITTFVSSTPPSTTSPSGGSGSGSLSTNSTTSSSSSSSSSSSPTPTMSPTVSTTPTVSSTTGLHSLLTTIVLCLVSSLVSLLN